MENCFNLLVQTRLMNLFYHNAHNLVGRVSFFSDHDFFGSAYGCLDTIYDGIAERGIGLYGMSFLNTGKVLSIVAQKFTSLPSLNVKSNKDYFVASEKLESELRMLCDKVMKDPKTSEGTKNMIAAVMDDSEVRSYKIKQRLL